MCAPDRGSEPDLFEKRDLMALLRGEPPDNKQININQLVLL